MIQTLPHNLHTSKGRALYFVRRCGSVWFSDFQPAAIDDNAGDGDFIRTNKTLQQNKNVFFHIYPLKFFWLSHSMSVLLWRSHCVQYIIQTFHYPSKLVKRKLLGTERILMPGWRGIINLLHMWEWSQVADSTFGVKLAVIHHLQCISTLSSKKEKKRERKKETW